MFPSPLARSWRQTSVWALFPNVQGSIKKELGLLTCENWLCFHLNFTLQTRLQIYFFFTVACNYYNKIKVPKLGALCKVMSRITRVPKQDHIRRNCWATFFKEPCLLAATCKNTDISVMEKLLFWLPDTAEWCTYRLLFLYWKTIYHCLHIKIHTKN